MNHKRTWRIYREAKLHVLRRRKRGLMMVERQQLLLPTMPDVTWPMDFIFDRVGKSRALKVLNIVDDFTKEAIDIVAGNCTPFSSAQPWSATPVNSGPWSVRIACGSRRRRTACSRTRTTSTPRIHPSLRIGECRERRNTPLRYAFRPAGGERDTPSVCGV